MHTSIATFVQNRTNYPLNADELRLKRLMLELIEDYPDMYGMAYAEARKILHKYTRRFVDPSTVYWHRFQDAASSARTFTGWKHFGTPVESLTLVELVMHRFSVSDQQATDELQVYGGFYTDGPEHDVFDERNEVAMLPGDVLRDFWALDFGAIFEASNQAFWSQHGTTFRNLIKTRYLAAAGLQRREGSLSRRNFQLVTDAVIGKLPAVMTMDKLQAIHAPQSGVSLRTFDIGGLLSAECLRVVHVDGRQILYIPSEQRPFRTFDSEQSLYHWMQGRLARPNSREKIEKLFLRSDSARKLHGAQFQEASQRIAVEPWNPDQPVLNQQNVEITGDVFAYLANVAKRETMADASVLLTSNASLRKQMWIGYLDAFIHVFGAFAPLGWPIALTLIGASAVNLVLNTDQAINGRTARQRRSGMIGILSNSIFILFNLPMLAGLARAEEVKRAGSLAGPLPAQGSVEPLQSGETPSHESIEMQELPHQPESLPDGATPPMQGIEQTGNGESWITLNEMPYPVSYNRQLRSWEIISVNDPLIAEDAQPVRLNGSGEWELSTPLAERVGNGVEPSGVLSNQVVASPSYRTIRSRFWDKYMQFNLQDEEHLSELGLARQQAAVNIRISEQGAQLLTASDGSQIWVDAWGEENRVFKTADGRYVSGCIPIYTARSEAFNQFLRTGVAAEPDPARLIARLDKDLIAIGRNNEVTLYRGGSQARGTSGLAYRSGLIRSGDVLINTDITSFSENPYMARVFSSSQAGSQSASFLGDITFDDSSIVFELPVRRYLGATPIGPFSGDEQEVESLFMPGHYFEIDSIDEVSGVNYKFMRVRLTEVPYPQPGRGVYDLRTAQLFSRSQYAGMLGLEGAELVDRFFPLAD
ncbi:MAG TPA: DUF6543 domain-containing protein [Pseudomonas sp.]|jgi:hypothetical protein